MTERHTRWILIILVVGQLLLLTAQVRDPGGESSYLEAGMMRIVAPLGASVAWVGDSIRGVGRNVSLNRTLAAENRQLRSELEQLREESIRNFGLEGEMRRLSEALQYQRTTGVPLQAADITFIDHASWLQTAIVVVEPGSVRTNQPVVASGGLVGRVVLVSGRYAKIQLITDRAASVGSMIERTRRQGVIRGGGRGALNLDFVPLQADVQVGDVVVTAGIDGVYPRGVPIGTVAEVSAGADLFHVIRVVPRVDFGLLDQVFVLASDAVPEEVKEDLPDARP